jgi:FAD/FMN-containing dehydrogenase
MTKSRKPGKKRGQGAVTLAWVLRRVLPKALLLGAILLTVACFAVYFKADDHLLFSPQSLVITDITQLQRIQVAEVKQPRTTEEIAQLLKSSTGPVSIGGSRASMGGQIAEPGSLHLDLRGFNRILEVDPENKRITVQAGATWRDLQDALDPHNLSVKIMQTYSNFTVGGSLSVNAHGRYMGAGPIAQSVQDFQLILASGEVLKVSRSQNPELFYGALGGYGGLGVIGEVTLDVVPNSNVKRSTHTLEADDYGDYFEKHIRHDENVIFQNADLHPPDFTSARSVSWRKTEEPLTNPERLIARGQSYPLTSRLINGTADFPFGFEIRRYLLEPLFYAQNVVTTRNHEASYDAHELEPKSRQESTYVLREYFVPSQRYREFLAKMRAVFELYQPKIINVSVRHATADPGTLLAWSRGETFAFVVYYEQGTDADAIAAVGQWSRAMVDAVLEVGGTYYLPYQNHPTLGQFTRAYPKAAEFFALKRQVDPQLRFQNSLMARYGPNPRVDRELELAKLEYRKKPEGRTLLTVPEWYLVWNPGEYVAHLESGRPPDTFPFVESVREYWSLYKEMRRAHLGVYPEDAEYLTTLRVIGVSTSVEYLLKAAYERSLGRLFRGFSSQKESAEEQVILDAQRAYVKFIYDEPWYAFGFAAHIQKIWQTPWLGPNFVRRTERRLFFTAEFGLKSLYASLLTWAAQTAYGPSQERVQLVSRKPATTEALPSGAHQLGTLSSGEVVFDLPRWREFSEIVPLLAERGYEFVDIAGNDEIVVSLIEREPRPFEAHGARRLADSRVLSNPSSRRSLWWVPVPSLAGFLREAERTGHKLEHIYDY